MDQGLGHGSGAGLGIRPRGCSRVRALNVHVCGDGKKTSSFTTTVLPLVIKYTVATRWRSPVDEVAGLGWLTV